MTNERLEVSIRVLKRRVLALEKQVHADRENMRQEVEDQVREELLREFDLATSELHKARLRLAELESRAAHKNVLGPAQSPFEQPLMRAVYCGGMTSDLAVCDDRASEYFGWLCCRHPDGQWVTLVKITDVVDAIRANDEDRRG